MARWRDLRLALGGLVLASAGLEWELRSVLARLLNDDVFWWVFEGESTERLLTFVERAVEELSAGRRYTDADYAELIARLRRWNDLR
jgi:hypothetical protein